MTKQDSNRELLLKIGMQVWERILKRAKLEKETGMKDTQGYYEDLQALANIQILSSE